MQQEDLNNQKRKTIPLKASESLSFFFLPFAFFGTINKKNNDFNKSEIERFKRYGFDLKLKQARELTIFGRIFYMSLIFIIIYLIKY
ncbi:hypothetical protein [uncultured Winogradskyella sp.]|uniref:hypothetical protein n=1 Tax=uncultured Winogradskyella sp. TaxID=395353 RepID=UPI002624AEEB|nr:hypothetical protein [uncultured Winogradskyella sp.]